MVNHSKLCSKSAMQLNVQLFRHICRMDDNRLLKTLMFRMVEVIANLEDLLAGGS